MLLGYCYFFFKSRLKINCFLFNIWKLIIQNFDTEIYWWLGLFHLNIDQPTGSLNHFYGSWSSCKILSEKGKIKPKFVFSFQSAIMGVDICLNGIALICPGLSPLNMVRNFVYNLFSATNCCFLYNFIFVSICRTNNAVLYFLWQILGNLWKIIDCTCLLGQFHLINRLSSVVPKNMGQVGGFHFFFSERKTLPAWFLAGVVCRRFSHWQIHCRNIGLLYHHFIWW